MRDPMQGGGEGNLRKREEERKWERIKESKDQ